MEANSNRSRRRRLGWTSIGAQVEAGDAGEVPAIVRHKGKAELQRGRRDPEVVVGDGLTQGLERTGQAAGPPGDFHVHLQDRVRYELFVNFVAMSHAFGEFGQTDA